MPRKRKQDIRVNDTASLEGLCQETYNDACLQITDAQKAINELGLTMVPADIDDLTKIVKEKSGLLKVKDSAIRIKLELAKLQSDIIKNRGDAEAAIEQRSDGTATLNNFRTIREMLKGNSKDNEEETE